jgi:hypothetical protein
LGKRYERILDTDISDEFNGDIMISLTSFFDEILEGGGRHVGRMTGVSDSQDQ